MIKKAYLAGGCFWVRKRGALSQEVVDEFRVIEKFVIQPEQRL